MKAAAPLAHDSSGFGNDGTLTNMESGTDWVAGEIKNALDFDGSNEYVDMGDIDLLDGEAEGTICTWLYYDVASVSTDGVLVSKYESGSDGWLLWIDDSTAYSGRTDTVAFAPDAQGGTSGRVEGSQGLVTPYVWDHYCGVFKGDDYIRLYKNGALDQENSTTTSTVFDTSTFPVRLGNIYSNSRNLEGMLDDVRIYNYALTEQQIKEVFNSGGGITFQ